MPDIAPSRNPKPNPRKCIYNHRKSRKSPEKAPNRQRRDAESHVKPFTRILKPALAQPITILEEITRFVTELLYV